MFAQLCATAFVAASLASIVTASATQDLQAAIRLVNEGDFEGALGPLAESVARLSAQQGLEDQVAMAQLYIATAHLGLNRLDEAKVAVAAAWRARPNMALDADAFPPTVLQLYALLRANKGKYPEGNGSRSKLPLVLAGVGVAAGGGVAVVAHDGATAPGMGIQITPLGYALMNVTEVAFTVSRSESAVDWEFGDGGTARGVRVSHVFSREGPFTVRATSGKEEASIQLIVRSLTGNWRFGGSGGILQVTQEGRLLKGSWISGNNTASRLSGSLEHPRRVRLVQGGECERDMHGDTDETIDRIQTTLTYERPACADCGIPGGIGCRYTLTRQ